MSLISSSAAPSNTGVAIGTPRRRLLRQLHDLVVGQRVEVLASGRRSCCRSCRGTSRSSPTCGLRLEHAADLHAQALRRPAQVGLQHLADVHARRHAQRIQHDVDRRAVGDVRHVLDRHDRRDHALVAVAAGHLVARLHAALHREVDLDHLEHARGEVVARGDLRALLLEAAARTPCAAACRRSAVCFELRRWPPRPSRRISNHLLARQLGRGSRR